MNSSLVLIMAWTCPAFNPPELVGQINNLEIDEASGLVALASPERILDAQRLWRRARLFAFDQKGASLGQVQAQQPRACRLGGSQRWPLRRGALFGRWRHRG